MSLEEFRSLCLSKQGAVEDMPFGDGVLVMKVGGKMFALISLDSFPLQVNLKCDPLRAVELREHYASIVPGFHMNKKHWNTIRMNSDISYRLVAQLLDDSYILVLNSLSKTVRQSIC